MASEATDRPEADEPVKADPLAELYAPGRRVPPTQAEPVHRPRTVRRVRVQISDRIWGTLLGEGCRPYLMAKGLPPDARCVYAIKRLTYTELTFESGSFAEVPVHSTYPVFDLLAIADSADPAEAIATATPDKAAFLDLPPIPANPIPASLDPQRVCELCGAPAGPYDQTCKRLVKRTDPTDRGTWAMIPCGGALVAPSDRTQPHPSPHTPNA